MKVKRCVYCGGDASPIECGQPEDEESLDESRVLVGNFRQTTMYTSNFGKQRPKPEDKMRRKHSDK